MPADVDSPWSIDDLARRLFQNLFDNQVPEEEQYRRRQRRLALVSLFDAVLDGDCNAVARAGEELVHVMPRPPLRGYRVEFEAGTDQVIATAVPPEGVA